MSIIMNDLADIKPKYGRDDVDYSTWYNPGMKSAALRFTKEEIIAGIWNSAGEVNRYSRSHLDALKAMDRKRFCTQRVAQSGSMVECFSISLSVLKGALEIYELFPEHTKEGQAALAKGGA